MNITKIKFTKKRTALGLLLIPILFLMAFAIGEGLSPDFGISGFILHLAQALPLVGLFIICLKRPKVGGKILILISLILALVLLFAGNGPVGIRVVPIIILCGLPFTSGIILLKSLDEFR